MNSPLALPLENVSPSRVRDLQQCMLRVAFAQHADRMRAPSDAQLVGDAAHIALAEVVRSNAVREEGATSIATELFMAEITRRAPEREVRRVRPAAARLRKVVEQVRALLDEAGTSAQTLCEERLTARAQALVGVVDLIIDSPRLHAVVDYKTGEVVDEAGQVLDQYASQLQLYSVLERERSGRWPSRGVLLRFGGSPVRVDLERETCEAAAASALAARLDYNAHAGEVPPAAPSEQACVFCPFAPSCHDFWDALSPDWTPGAVCGSVAWAEDSSAGGLTVGLANARGTFEGDLVVRRLQIDRRTQIAIEPGAELSVCGVRRDADGRLVASRGARVAVAASGGERTR